ncbi:MAG TPA: hypothetical protein VF502_05195 [Stellaceae bacterium]
MPRAMTDDRQRQQRAKNLALLAVLAGVVVLFYVMALVKMGAF